MMLILYLSVNTIIFLCFSSIHEKELTEHLSLSLGSAPTFSIVVQFPFKIFEGVILEDFDASIEEKIP